MVTVWLLALLGISIVLAYNRASAIVWAISLGLLLFVVSRISAISTIALSIWLALYLIIFIPLLIKPIRKKLITQHLLKIYRVKMPSMSRTEREALAAGTVGWEGELFKGSPNWDKWLSYPKPELSSEEQAFIDGPVESLCKMLDDWDITHNRADLPPEVWDFLKEKGFFGLIVPKQYGGMAISAYAQLHILTKVYGKSITAATTIGVPNSLGPAELLQHYGTEEQKNYYLPRLAKGIEIPCFALTGPDAGSDAGAMVDYGIICRDKFEGKDTLGIRLNFNKRYITLAPVATVIGLAFKLYDPDHLIGAHKDLGITCALIPRNTPGITIGRRHFPVNIVFQNGPVQGKDVFIPIDWIIGGQKMAGQGWRMLMECLAAGRAITLPASALGGAEMLTYASGAYARIRRQFNVPIGHFEGIEEVLARIAAHTYVMAATSAFTAGIIDTGEKPSVASAITKYHVTELGRKVSSDAMDLHGGKGICLGPRNYLGRFFESIPIAITVEGANILTRCMIIFGQGAMRCHPYIFTEYEAAKLNDPNEALAHFDKAIIGHIGFLFSNAVRSFVLALTGSFVVRAPKGKTHRYFQYVTRFSSAFALIADVSLSVLGGGLKRKESISARLGDILSYLYLLSAVLKHYHNQGKNVEDLPIIHWLCQTYFYKIQKRFQELFKNFPNRFLAGLMQFFIFPLGKHFTEPTDKMGQKIAQLILAPTESRARLTEAVFTSAVENNPLSWLEDALFKVIAAEPVEKVVRNMHHEGLIQGETVIEQAKSAFIKQLISQEQLDTIISAEDARQKVIAVDDFSSEELAHHEVKKTYHDYVSYDKQK